MKKFWANADSARRHSARTMLDLAGQEEALGSLALKKFRQNTRRLFKSPFVRVSESCGGYYMISLGKKRRAQKGPRSYASEMWNESRCVTARAFLVARARAQLAARGRRRRQLDTAREAERRSRRLTAREARDAQGRRSQLGGFEARELSRAGPHWQCTAPFFVVVVCVFPSR